MGVGAGTLSGLFGVAGWFLIVMALTGLLGMVLLASLPNPLAKGTSLAAVIPIAAFATWRNVRSDNADVRLGVH